MISKVSRSQDKKKFKGTRSAFQLVLIIYRVPDKFFTIYSLFLTDLCTICDIRTRLVKKKKNDVIAVSGENISPYY